jgi:nucleoside 2-deoxyribosyltransferase
VEVKFYIASSFQNKEQVHQLSKALTSLGYIHAYDWTRNERASSIAQLRKIGELEKCAVMESDFLVVLLPGGKGSHIEMGIAVGLDKPVYIFSPNEDVYDFSLTSTFYHLPQVTLVVGGLEELLAIIKRG